MNKFVTTKPKTFCSECEWGNEVREAKDDPTCYCTGAAVSKGWDAVRGGEHFAFVQCYDLNTGNCPHFSRLEEEVKTVAFQDPIRF